MKENTKKELFSWAKTIGFTLVLIAIIRGVLFTPSLVQGESMMPTLENNERVLVNKIGYSISGLERFDIIVFHGKEGYDLVKRVIGLPGDTVEYKNDVLYVNGKAMEEPYLKEFKEKAKRPCINSRLYVRTNHRKNESARRSSVCFRG